MDFTKIIRRTLNNIFIFFFRFLFVKNFQNVLINYAKKYNIKYIIPCLLLLLFPSKLPKTVNFQSISPSAFLSYMTDETWR